MKTIKQAVYFLSKSGASVSAVILVCMILHILVEIVLRSFFATSTYVLDEFVGYGIAAMTFLSMGYALENGSLIRVNLLLSRLGTKIRKYLELFCLSITAIIFGFLIKYFWAGVFYRDFVRGTVSSSISEIPLWIPEGLVLIGMILFMISLGAYMLRLIYGEAPIE